MVGVRACAGVVCTVLFLFGCASTPERLLTAESHSEALRELEKQTPEERARVVPSLINALKTGNASQRQLAAGSLAKMGPEAEQAVVPLIGAMDRHGDLGIYGYVALAHIGGSRPEAIPQLIKGLGVVGAAADARTALIGQGAQAVPALLDAYLKSTSGDETKVYAELLVMQPQALLGRIDEKLPTAPSHDAALLIRLLDRLHSADATARICRYWLEGLTGSDKSISGEVAEVLLSVKDPCLEEAANVIEHGPADKKLAAIRMLAMARPDAAKYRDHLAAGLNDPSGSVRSESLRAIQAYGGTAAWAESPVAAYVSGHLKDRSTTGECVMGVVALRGLGALGEASLPVLVSAFSGPDATVYLEAATTLQKAGEPAIRYVEPLLKNRDSAIRARTVALLKGIGSPAAIQIVKAYLRSSASDDVSAGYGGVAWGAGRADVVQLIDLTDDTALDEEIFDLFPAIWKKGPDVAGVNLSMHLVAGEGYKRVQDALKASAVREESLNHALFWNDQYCGYYFIVQARNVDVYRAKLEAKYGPPKSRSFSVIPKMWEYVLGKVYSDVSDLSWIKGSTQIHLLTSGHVDNSMQGYSSKVTSVYVVYVNRAIIEQVGTAIERERTDQATEEENRRRQERDRDIDKIK